MSKKNNSKTFKYEPLMSNELDRIKLEPTENIDVNSINIMEDDFSSLSTDVLEYKLNNTKLNHSQKKQIKQILKSRK